MYSKSCRFRVPFFEKLFEKAQISWGLDDHHSHQWLNENQRNHPHSWEAGIDRIVEGLVYLDDDEFDLSSSLDYLELSKASLIESFLKISFARRLERSL